MCHYIRQIAHPHFVQGTHTGNFQYSGEGVSLLALCVVLVSYIPDLKLKGHTQQYRVDPNHHDAGVGRNV